MDARGYSLVEMLMTVAVIALAAGAAASIAGPALAREGMRGDLYAIAGAMQRGRVEAVSRNRACQVMVNTEDGRILVVDGMGTGSTSDDVVVQRGTISSRSSFAAPGGGSPLTVDKFVGAWYGVEFDSDGTVGSGVGQIALSAGDRYGRISIFAGGGAQVSFWKDGAWDTTGG